MLLGYLRRFRTTLLFMLIFGGLAMLSALIILTRQSSGSHLAITGTPVTPQTGYIFTDVEPGKITRISVVDHGTAHTVTYTRVPGDWNVDDSAGKIKASDLPNVARIIQILATLRYNRVLEGSSVAAYGLAGDGKVGIDFDAAGKSYHLRIGEATPYGDTTYVQRGDSPSIYLVQTAVVAILTNALATPPPNS
jgi:hypothetical protein